jgi:hypothetical protein
MPRRAAIGGSRSVDCTQRGGWRGAAPTCSMPPPAAGSPGYASGSRGSSRDSSDVDSSGSGSGSGSRDNSSTSGPSGSSGRYPLARQMRRTVVAHLGPTNSGKTHAALTELMRARRSVILGVAPIWALVPSGVRAPSIPIGFPFATVGARAGGAAVAGGDLADSDSSTRRARCVRGLRAGVAHARTHTHTHRHTHTRSHTRSHTHTLAHTHTQIVPPRPTVLSDVL